MFSVRYDLYGGWSDYGGRGRNPVWGGELMGRKVAGRDRAVRPLTYSAAAFAAIAALFHPMPASAAPTVPPPPPAPNAPVPPPAQGAQGAPGVPDAGARPVVVGTLAMPGQQSGRPGTTTPAATTLPGVAMTPLLQKIERQRTAIAVLGDKLIKVGEDRDLARQQQATAEQKLADARTALITAQQDAAAAAAAAVRDQAALPPGTIGSGLADLDRLSRMQRGDSSSQQAAEHQLTLVQAAVAGALAEQGTAATNATELTRQYDKLNADITKKQTALQKDEQKHAQEISAAEAALSAEDRRLGQRYLDGTDQGRGADPRAIAALNVALAQIGDPYVWSEEGPNQFDCSGLMFYAYRKPQSGNFPLQRVSRDQYRQTSQNLVDRYSLVAGDLLFFSSSNSWTGIHHVAMYAGKGMMVEAPRSGLNVRLVPVRWSRLFGATRIWGSVDHPTKTPDLTKLPAKEPNPGATPNPTKTTKPPTSNPTTPPTTKPPTKPPTTKPTPPTKPPTKPPTTPPSTPPSSPDPTGSDSASPGNGQSDNADVSESPSSKPSGSASDSQQASASDGSNQE